MRWAADILGACVCCDWIIVRCPIFVSNLITVTNGWTRHTAPLKGQRRIINTLLCLRKDDTNLQTWWWSDYYRCTPARHPHNTPHQLYWTCSDSDKGMCQGYTSCCRCYPCAQFALSANECLRHYCHRVPWWDFQPLTVPSISLLDHPDLSVYHSGTIWMPNVRDSF